MLLNTYYYANVVIKEYSENIIINSVDFFKRPILITLYKNNCKDLPYRYQFNKELFGITTLFANTEREIGYCLHLEMWIGA
jgi:hypothetical protein